MDTRSIRTAIQEAARYLTEHPEAGASTDTAATAVHEGGLRFRVDGPQGSVTTDMPPAVGGRGASPSPGWLLRAALASCDATLVAMEAARDGVELGRLEVTVASESDDRGLLGTDGSVPPGPLAVRVRIRAVARDVARDRLREIVERAESRSPVRDGLARVVRLTTEIITE